MQTTRFNRDKFQASIREAFGTLCRGFTGDIVGDEFYIVGRMEDLLLKTV